MFTVISGGTSTNELVNLFESISNSVSYILPISDNGGSTSELIRVIGGPAIGDVRSRITRLIPNPVYKHFFSYRLPEEEQQAEIEWNEIVSGTHQVWKNIELPIKELIRSFLIHIHMELLKKSRPGARNFNFAKASIGNMFLSGARLFVGSLDSAIELMLRICNIPQNTSILPCLNTNFTYHISAVLEDGSIITGQSQISHPISKTVKDQNFEISSTNGQNTPTPSSHTASSFNDYQMIRKLLIDNHERDNENEFAVPVYTHPELTKSQLHFTKDDSIPLPSPIRRVFYISPYGEEVFPVAQSRVIKAVDSAETVVYSIGSLFTSIIPVLILQGMGQAILSKKRGNKVLLLNGSYDRETFTMTALDFVKHIHEALDYSMSLQNGKLSKTKRTKYRDFITHVFYPEQGEILVDADELAQHGIKGVPVKGQSTYDLDDLEMKLSIIHNKVLFTN
ncbi:hypothetical protein PP7435_CHR1-1189 [Komagataella phaffii CBS 7435]|uniref:Uncharacterized protein n=2 Tax=Komagataella phaffii TaxID=460519 RepID=C4QYC4_KOMPG|nr:uncharacterized protein PAS_chr1-4_0400 [Komagataella phaffii GS115]AOA61085.1 GQ67_01763T0 [Komagataella phaffii]CAH2447070.1 hypothetical protein BQ9382_C1-6260 [Komagataella phaffii CBS 7435]AOA65465.1 GQ68_01778T0 [Komagataella phaffii GS115]CAY68247.1 hypothetical protein PAS_chr1-4_0400 [Komagataella phaffii GS115]CCA37317.1 hypothetical protein PP7435_CHR1-1189 [Komagataella phaffii CBS 7435]